MKLKFLFLSLSFLFITHCVFSQSQHPETRAIKSKTIVFIHGLFVNPESWNAWKAWFEAKGYKCYAPANPYHEGIPADLRKNIDPRLAMVNFEDVVNNVAKLIDTLPEKPIIIGHSMAGLVVQKLISMNKAAAGVCIDGAAPPGIITLKWSFWKANLPAINPFKGSSVFRPTKKWFHYAFCNTMTRAESDKVFDEIAVPESRNIPRGTLKKFARIDVKKPHNPLLIIAGEKDHIVPASLNIKNFKAYKDTASVITFKEFKGRGHYIVGEPDWQEVAGYVYNWLNN
jgi:pimeloyl-ACP methyl ester carboxylesterase